MEIQNIALKFYENYKNKLLRIFISQSSLQEIVIK